VIAKISPGWNIGGLVRYLMGPGRFNQHENQRVIATWDGAPELHQPPPNASVCGFDVAALTTDLNDPAVAAGIAHNAAERGPNPPRRGPVWHCSLRNAPGDRVLSDARWAEVVTDLMDRTGIAPRGDLGACRWVVIRHAADHVHVAAMLVRQDNGRRVYPRNDYYRAKEVCEDAERRLGLTQTGAADRTAAARPTRAEMEKAARRGADEPSREWLRRAARIAAVQARDPDAYVRRLAELGVLVRPREMPSGHLVGYSIAAVGDVNAEQMPVWFSGGKLARDLTLPQLLARWRSAPPPTDPMPPAPGEHARVGRAERREAIAEATAAAHAAAAALHAAKVLGGAQQTAGHRATDDGATPADSAAAGGLPGMSPDGAAIAHATGDLLTALCAVTDRGQGPVPWAAADRYDRAARTPYVVQPRRWPPVAAQLRQAAWRLIALRSVSRRRRDEDDGVAELIVAVAALAAEIAALYEQRRCLAQAAAARHTGHILRRPAPGQRPPARPGPAPQHRTGGPRREPPTPTSRRPWTGPPRTAARVPGPDDHGPAPGANPGRRGRAR
jgi:hypothetical protein